MDAAELLAVKQLRTADITVDLGHGRQTVIHVQALPRVEYRALLDKYPPVDGSDADWLDGMFQPALIAACAVDPVFTFDQAKQLWDEWEVAAGAALFIGCWQLNDRTASMTFGLPGFVETGDSGPKSDTVLNEASAIPIS